jgi:hypothetical protein
VVGLVLDCGDCQYGLSCMKTRWTKREKEVVLEARCKWLHKVDVPLPFDHFFFCFFPPVAAGAIFALLLEKVRWTGEFVRREKIEGGDHSADR